MYWSTIMLNTK